MHVKRIIENFHNKAGRKAGSGSFKSVSDKTLHPRTRSIMMGSKEVLMQIPFINMEKQLF